MTEHIPLNPQQLDAHVWKADARVFDVDEHLARCGVGSATSRIATRSGPLNSATTAARTTTLLFSVTCRTSDVW